MSDRRPFTPLAAYRHIHRLETRWADNDVYGHINNVAYYSFFDTVVNTTLIEKGMLDIEKGPIIGLVVETGCRYASSISYPARLDIGLGVTKLGSSSVHYQLGVAPEVGDVGGDVAGNVAVEGRFIHVYVDRETRRPKELPKSLREFLSGLLLPE